jgi:hypothetical protein
MSNNNSANANSKQAWTKPQLRAVVPASHTRGGTVKQNKNSENPFYMIS